MASNNAPATVTLSIAGMNCGSCVSRVEGALRSVPGVLEAAANLATQKVTFRVLADSVRTTDLVDALARAGYQGAPLDDTSEPAEGDDTAQAQEIRRLKHGVGIAAALTAPIVVLDMSGHFIPAMHHLLWSRPSCRRCCRPVPPTSTLRPRR